MNFTSKKAREAARRDAVILVRAARLVESYSTLGLYELDVVPRLDALAGKIIAAVDEAEPNQ